MLPTPTAIGAPARWLGGALRPAALVTAAALAGRDAAAQVPAPAANEAPACALSEDDRAWVERALDAWRLATREITGIGDVPRCEALFFDASCVLASRNALTSTSADDVTWTATPHDGEVPMPDGSKIPAGVTSFASGDEGLRYFVMSTPSVWTAGGVSRGPRFEATLVAVMLHESSHIAQLRCYGKRLGALIDAHALPDDFDDNAVQDRFGTNAEFSASVHAETALFLRAAAERDDLEARLLADDARHRMRARAERFFVGDDAYLREAEDLWLTFEGAGQWTGYRWLIHPQGGGEDPESLPGFTRGSNWSQIEGFALFLALDRLMGAQWKDHAYGDGAKTALEMLDAALAE